MKVKQVSGAFRGFTLIELLTVLSIVSLLAALLFPVFGGTKKAAFRTYCQDNLRQIGLAFTLYAGDYDDVCPYAIDQFSRDNPESIPANHAPLNQIPDIVPVLSLYLGKSREVFHCPSDVTSYTAYSEEVSIGTFPTYFAYAGTSYSFLAYVYFGKSLTTLVAQPYNVLSHDATLGHSEYTDPNYFTPVENSLYADGHVRFTDGTGQE